MSVTLNELKSYYSALLISQYRTKERAIATIETVAGEIWLDNLPSFESTCFDLNSAVGEQLNVLGRIVGVERDVQGLDLENTYFEFTNYAGTVTGINFASYSDLDTTEDLFSRYFVDAVTNMDDGQFRNIIKLKIIFNTAIRTMKYVKEALYAEFAGSIDITDNLDLSLDFDVYDPYYSVIDIAEYLNIMPKSMGVSYTVNQL